MASTERAPPPHVPGAVPVPNGPELLEAGGSARAADGGGGSAAGAPSGGRGGAGPDWPRGVAEREREEARRRRRRGVAGVYLRAKVRALDAQFDAGGTLELGLAAAAVCLAHPCLHGRHTV